MGKQIYTSDRGHSHSNYTSSSGRDKPKLSTSSGLEMEHLQQMYKLVLGEKRVEFAILIISMYVFKMYTYISKIQAFTIF